HPADGLASDHLDIERAGRRTVVRTGGMADVDSGLLVHGGNIATIKHCSSRGHFSGIARASYALSAKVSPALSMDGLARDVPRCRAAEKAHSGGDILRLATLTGKGPVGGVMGRFGLAPRPRRADQAGNDTIDGDAVGGQFAGERPCEADDASLGCHHMGAV